MKLAGGNSELNSIETCGISRRRSVRLLKTSGLLTGLEYRHFCLLDSIAEAGFL